MKKIALFVEGQSELIFVRNFLLRIIDNATLSFECIKLHGERQIPVSYKYTTPNPDYYFLIINVENDSKVLSAIKEREGTLLEKGFLEIIGLRDMYCEEYESRSNGVIDDNLSRQFIDNANTVILDMSNSDAITLFFSIMELEAWFLSMYNLFQKINSTLTLEFIETECGYNLMNIDPQVTFYKPSSEIRKILQLSDFNYRKSQDDIERITSKMENSDFENAFENNRCDNFKRFYQKIKSIAE